MDLVSIIVPVFNQGKYLTETLESVLKQTYQKWECVIVNDGSTDNSERIALEFVKRDQRFKYFHQENFGVSAARNNGIMHSNGQFILPLDGDDIILPRYIKKCVEHFNSHPETTVVTAKAKRFGTNTGIWRLPKYSWDTIIWINCLVVCSMFKRSDYDKTGGYSEELGYLEDWDFWLSLLNPDSIVFQIEEVLFKYRLRSDGAHIATPAVIEKATDYIYLKHKDIYAPYASKLLYIGMQRLSYKNAFEKLSHYSLIGLLVRTRSRLRSSLGGLKKSNIH